MNSEWQLKRTMTKRQFKAAVRALKVSQAFCGRFVGISPRTLRRYVAGDSKVDTSVALLLNSMIAHNERPTMPVRRR